MFILKDKTQLERAIAKALKLRPRVEFDRFGRYRVSGSKNRQFLRHKRIGFRAGQRSENRQTAKKPRKIKLHHSDF